MKSIKPYICLVLFAIITGTTFQVAKEALLYFSPAQTGTLRFIVATILLLLFVFLTDRSLFKIKKLHLKSLISLGVIGVFGFNFFFFLGMHKASPVNAAIIVAMSPAITIFLSFLLLRTKITFIQYIGTAVSFLGVLVVVSDGRWNAIQTVLEGEGIVFILLAAICWAGYSVGMRKFLQGLPTVQITAYTSLFGTVALVILIFLSGEYQIDWRRIPSSAWFAILYMAVFTTFFGYIFWNYGIQMVGPQKAAIFGNLIPVVAMLTAWFLGDTPNHFDIIGTMLVILGIFIVNSKFKASPMDFKIKKSLEN